MAGDSSKAGLDEPSARGWTVYTDFDRLAACATVWSLLGPLSKRALRDLHARVLRGKIDGSGETSSLPATSASFFLPSS